MRTTISLAAITILALCGAAAAQAPPPAPAPGTTVTTHSTGVTHGMALTGTSSSAARSKACSDQADAKGLHGKERKTFRGDCKHGKI